MQQSLFSSFCLDTFLGCPSCPTSFAPRRLFTPGISTLFCQFQNGVPPRAWRISTAPAHSVPLLLSVLSAHALSRPADRHVARTLFQQVPRLKGPAVLN